jgi:alpha-ketoglutarate-dependent taurine dioxygenase
VLQQAALEAHGVLVFPNQKPTLSMRDQVNFASHFGPIEPHPVATGLAEAPEVLEIVREPGATVVFGEDWHSDFSFMSPTCSYSFLRATAHMPRRGVNDTLFSSTEEAYDALSSTMQGILDEMYAYHSANKAYNAGSDTNSTAAMQATGSMRYALALSPPPPTSDAMARTYPRGPSAHGSSSTLKWPSLAFKSMPLTARVWLPTSCACGRMLDKDDDKLAVMERDVRHPLVAVHPFTGRRSIFVSPTFTTHIDGLHPDESASLLAFLYRWIEQPRFCNRVSWSPHQVTMWDNRMLLHKGIVDEVDELRVVHRVSVRGHTPFGVHDAACDVL